MQEIFLASGIGLLWGVTNPFLEQGAKGISSGDEAGAESKRSCFLVRWAVFFWKLFVNCKFFVPFAVNQAGSLLFYYALGNSSITLVVPVSNCVGFTTTYICESLLKKTPIDCRKDRSSLSFVVDLLSIFAVVLGIFIAFYNGSLFSAS